MNHQGLDKSKRNLQEEMQSEHGQLLIFYVIGTEFAMAPKIARVAQQVLTHQLVELEGVLHGTFVSLSQGYFSSLAQNKQETG